MANARKRLVPAYDPLESREVPSGSAATLAVPAPLGDVNGDGRLTLADERAFTAAFGSRVGDPRFNPAADLNHNEAVGQVDGRILLGLLAPQIPKGPIHLDLRLAPGQQVRPPLSAVSGGETRQAVVTIVGRTKPGALIFTDPPAADFTFSGPAFAADANGAFRQVVRLRDGITTFNFEVIDPYGHRVIRAFPIRLKAPGF